MKENPSNAAQELQQFGEVDESDTPGKRRATELSREHVERSYRFYAPIYDVIFGRSLGQGRTAMTEMVTKLNPATILEVGVGTGLTLEHYPRSAKITGIDVSREMLAVATRRLDQNDSERVSLNFMDAEDMDFADASFDCVTLPYVLSVTPHPDRLVAEVRRVCKPGGHIVVVNHFSGQSSWRPLEALARPLSKWLGFRSEFPLHRHITSHPWSVLSTERTNMFGLSRLIHIRND